MSHRAPDETVTRISKRYYLWQERGDPDIVLCERLDDGRSVGCASLTRREARTLMRKLSLVLDGPLL